MISGMLQSSFVLVHFASLQNPCFSFATPDSKQGSTSDGDLLENSWHAEFLRNALFKARNLCFSNSFAVLFLAPHKNDRPPCVQ